MNDTIKTALSVAVAAGLAFAAWFVSPSTTVPPEFSDQGALFSPAFTDPLSARSLEVVGIDEASASYKAFKVEHDGARWVIPSHHNYPADAEQKMAEAASAFIGLAKEQVVSDSPSEHAAFGVLAPDDDKAPVKGRGVRVTVRGEGGATLSDLIVGDEVKGGPESADGPSPSSGRRYVRVPGQNRVYAATLKGGLSTRFADWIETDLLQLKDTPVARLEVFRGTIDEQTGRRTETERLVVTRNKPAPTAPGAPPAPAPATPWSVTAEPGGPPTDAEEVKTARVDDAVNALKSVKIVGVRPKPANLAKALGGGPEAQGVRINTADLLNLQSRGFYLTQEGRMLANEGEMTVACDDGVTYTLWFGEIAQGEGDALSAGLEEPATSKGDAPKDGGAPGESRYLFVTVSFDESLLGPAPQEPAKPATEGAPSGSADAPADGAKPAADAPAESTAKEAAPDPAQEEFKRLSAERETKVKAGKDRAAALSKRFADWWYVIDAAAFDRLRPTRAEVVGPKPSLSAPAGPEAGQPLPMPMSPPGGAPAGPTPQL